MTQEEYFEAFQEITHEMVAMTGRKNRDYAGAEDAFRNFRHIAHNTGGKITIEQGILVRMTDKMARLSTLLFQKTREVKSETIMDTLTDLAVYSVIMRIYLEDQLDANGLDPNQKDWQ